MTRFKPPPPIAARNLSSLPKELTGVLNVALKKRFVKKGEAVSLKVEGGYIRKTLPQDGVVYEDIEGNEILVLQDFYMVAL